MFYAELQSNDRAVNITQNRVIINISDQDGMYGYEASLKHVLILFLLPLSKIPPSLPPQFPHLPFLPPLSSERGDRV